MVILQCDEHGPVKKRVADLGIRKALEHDEDNYNIMQLHPADTGGSFLEIDVQAGGDDLDGPWMPAGPKWQDAKTDVVRGFRAAEIQSPDPAPLAARWGEILDRPVKGGSIDLDNVTIRFVEATDGRGEGLGGVDIAVADRDRVKKAASDRGVLDNDVVMIAGTRFRIV